VPRRKPHSPIRKIATGFVFIITAAISGAAQTTPFWLRYPAISPDGKTIVFTYQGDLYRVSSGGDFSADVTIFLSGSKFFDYTTGTRSNGYEPNFRWTKPSISIANEANYSDGPCYAFAYQHLKLGKLVGMPVPGTCTFAGWEMLQDGNVRWGVPPLGVKAIGVGYLENHQTEPDIKVMNQYDVVIKGRDQQLEAAVAALLKEIK